MRKFVLATVVALVGLVGFVAVPVLAESAVISSDGTSSIAADRVVEGVAYVVGDNVDVQGIVKGDLFCAGKNVIINGVVEGDVLCAGQNVTIAGEVKGDVRIAAVSLNTRGVIEGSMTLLGSATNIETGTKIGRDLTVAGGDAEIYGEVGRDLSIVGRTVSLRGKVGRDFKGTVENFNISSEASFAGNFSYAKNADITIPEGVVAGEVMRTPLEEGRVGGGWETNFLPAAAFVTVLMFTVATVFIALVAPRYVRRVTRMSSVKAFGWSLLVGIVTMVVTPMAIIMLLISFGGILAAFILGTAFLLALLAAGSLVAYRVGSFMLVRNRNVILRALVGALALGALGAIPFVGGFIVFISVATGLGMIVLGMKPEYENNTYSDIEVVPKEIAKEIATKKSKK